MFLLASASLAPAAARADLPPDPNGYYAPWEAEVVPEERGAIGLINQARTEAGVAPLRVSQTLSDAADRFAGFLERSNRFDHDAYGSPQSRAEAAGWTNGKCPCYGIAETLVRTSKAIYAVNSWLESPDHRSILLNPHLNAIGLAQAGRTWNADFGTCVYGTSQEPYCQMTADEGDASLASPPEPDPVDPPGDGTGDSPGDLGQLVMRALPHGRQVELLFALPKGDSGLTLTVSSRAGLIDRQLAGRDRVLTRMRLAFGRWTVRASTDSDSICRRLWVKSADGRSHGDGSIRLATRRC